MKLYLVRHGEAVEPSIDPKRPLSPKGEKDIQKIASLVENQISVEHIFHSGKKRAEQTAEIISQKIKASNAPKEIEGLMPDDPVEDVIEMISQLSESTMIVGHLPYLLNLTNKLLNQKNPIHVQFDAGSLICLEEVSTGTWGISWLISPKILSNH